MKEKKTFSTAFIFFILLFAALSFFSFISPLGSWQLFYAKLAWSLVISYIGFRIYLSGAIYQARSILFILTTLFFLLEFKLFRCLSITGKEVTPYCHIALAPTLLNFAHSQFLALTSGDWKIWGLLTLGFLWLLTMFTIGQGICSWVCFYGGIDEACSKILRKPVIKLKISRPWRDFPLAFLIFLLLISFLQGLPVFCSWFCPLKLTGAFWDTEPVTRFAQIGFFALFLIVFLILLPILTKKRTFCSLICPFGALVSVCGKVSPYRVIIDKEKCIRCGKCLDVCPSLAVEKKDVNYDISQYCNKCGKCVDICPVDAISITAGKMKARGIFIFLALLLSGVISGSFVPKAILMLLSQIL